MLQKRSNKTGKGNEDKIGLAYKEAKNQKM